MELAAQTVGLLLLMGATGLGPGLALVRRLPWNPLEKLVAAAALSLLLLYLAVFGLFISGAGAGADWIVSALAVGISITQAPAARRLFKQPVVRRVLLACGVLIVWLFLLLCEVRHYGGGSWAGDWAENYQRTQVLLGQFPLHKQMLGLYTMPARPPMMNVLAAFYCRQAGLGPQGQLRFESFSVAFLVLNASMLLPCCLLYRRFLAARRKRLDRRAMGRLVALFMLSAFVTQNATWTWTKLFCAAYVVLGVELYLRSLGTSHGRGGAYLLGSALALSAAMMVHYSAYPYVLALGLHDAVRRRWRDPAEARRWAVAAAAGVGVAVMWFAWCIHVFGWSDSAGGAYISRSGSPLEAVTPLWQRILRNEFFSIVPSPPTMTSGNGLPWFMGDSPRMFLSDYWFSISQGNLLLMLGTANGITLLLVVIARLRRGLAGAGVAAARFWVWLIAMGVVVACASTRSIEQFGPGMLCLPVLLMGLSFFAAELPHLPAVVRGLVLVGCAVDFALGVAVHFWLQGTIFRAEPWGNQVVIAHEGFSDTAARNWWSKHLMNVTFWGDRAAPLAGALHGLMIAGGAAALAMLAIGMFGPRRRPAWQANRRAGLAG